MITLLWVIRQWNRLPGVDVDALSLKVFQARFEWGFEQPGPVEGVVAHFMGVGTR